MAVNVQLGATPTVLQLEAAIVDLDGTMVDTLGDFAAAIAGMLHDLHLPALPASAIEAMVGKGSEHLIRSVLAHVLPSTSDPVQGSDDAVAALLPDALARYSHYYLAINGQYAQVYDGVVEGLQALKAAGVRLACVTNKPLAFTTPLLVAKGLDGLFEVVYGGDSFPKKKPDPLPLHQACAALGTTTARTLMVGDSSNDAQAARAAGCPVVLVSYGYNHGQSVHTVDADGVVDRLTQLQVA